MIEDDTSVLEKVRNQEDAEHGAAAASGNSAATAAMEDEVIGENSLRVLIVEDSSIVRGRIIRLVSGIAGVKVIGMAVDGTHALALFRELQPDVVVLDIQLPGLNGIELLARMRADQSRCKVIVLTTYAFEEFRRKCLDLQAEYFFDKALEFPRVVEVLERLAARKLEATQGAKP